MKKRKTQHQQILDLTVMALLTALTVVLAALASAIPIVGTTTLNLSLVSVIIGAVLYGYLGGAWLGGVSGFIILITGQAAGFMAIHTAGTIIVVMLKGILSGACAGIVYSVLKKFNEYLAIFVCAAVCPIVNTGIFFVGCLTFFLEDVSFKAAANGSSVVGFIILGYIGFNFVFEFLANVVLSPTIHRIIRIWYKGN